MDTDPFRFDHWYRRTGPQPSVQPAPLAPRGRGPGDPLPARKLALIAVLAFIAITLATVALTLPPGTARNKDSRAGAAAAGLVPGPETTVSRTSPAVIEPGPVVFRPGPARFAVRTVTRAGSGPAAPGATVTVPGAAGPAGIVTETAAGATAPGATAPGATVTEIATMTEPGSGATVTATETATVTAPGPTETVTATVPGPTVTEPGPAVTVTAPAVTNS